MKEVMGGCWFSGLIAWALLGIVPAIILFAIGAGAGIAALYQEEKQEQAEASWRKQYPSYKY